MDRLLVEPQCRGRFENVSTDLAGMFPTVVLETLVDPQRVGLVRYKIAEIAV